MHAGGYESMCKDMNGTAVVVTCLEESAVRLAIISQSPGGAAAQYVCQVEHLQRDTTAVIQRSNNCIIISAAAGPCSAWRATKELRQGARLVSDLRTWIRDVALPPLEVISCLDLQERMCPRK